MDLRKFSLLIAISCSFSIAFSQSLYFPPINGDTWDTLSYERFNWCPSKIDSLYTFLESNNTKAFIVLQNGKIVLEKYFGDFTKDKNWYWASAAKSLTACLVGIAQQEGHLNIQDKTSKYLNKGWTSCSPEQEDKISIWNQLTMTSGLDDTSGDPYCTVDTCLKYKADAGTRWAYHNAPYTLLDRVIEGATGKTLNAYTLSSLQNQTGIKGLFIKSDFNNVFYSTPRVFARFGLMILNKGNWNGTQILKDPNYFRDMTNTSQQLNKSYGYLWWLNGKESYMVPGSQIVFRFNLMPNAPSDMISGMGKNGQFVNVIPSKNMVWIRMGDAPDNSNVPFLLNDAIWKYMNELVCNTVSNTETYYPAAAIKSTIFTDHLILNQPENVTSLSIFNNQGILIKSYNAFRSMHQIPTHDLKSGVYFIRIAYTNHQSVWVKCVKL